MSVQVKGSGTIGGLDEGLVVSGIVTSSTQVNVGSNIKLGNAGVVTATSFVGSGANLTSLPAQATIANNADNRVITGGSGVNLNGESSLTYGSGLDVGGSGGITISSSGADLTMNSAGGIFTGNGGNATNPIVANVSDTNTGFFYPAADTIAVTTGGTERLRINSTGQVRIGGSITGSPQCDLDVVRANSTLTDVMLIKGNTGNGFIRFQDNDNSCNFTLGADDGAGLGANSFILYDRVNSAYRFGVDNSGNFKVHSGNIVIGTSGKGIDFGATGNGNGSMTSELLDDYEEGSWSPAFRAGNNATACPTTVNESRYTKVGRLVVATAYFTMNSYAAGGTGGDTRIVGLPYANLGDHGGVTINYWASLKQNVNYMSGTVQGSTSEILIRATTSADTATANIDFDNTFGPSDSLILTATYHTA